VYCFHDRTILLFSSLLFKRSHSQWPAKFGETSAPTERAQKESEKKKKDNLGNASGSYSNSAESRQSGKQSNDEESESPAQ
jgi:hypothetical protein